MAPGVCVLTGDGKDMLPANYHKGKCWVGRDSTEYLARADFVPPQCKWGSVLRAIAPCNRTWSMAHVALQTLL